MSTPVNTWKFEPRPCVSPKVAAQEWAWIQQWVTEQGLSGKVYVVRTVELDGEYATASFDVFHGRSERRDNETRNL